MLANGLEHSDILLVARMINLALDLDQSVEIDPVCRCLSIRRLFPPRPSVGKVLLLLVGASETTGASPHEGKPTGF